MARHLSYRLGCLVQRKVREYALEAIFNKNKKIKEMIVEPAPTYFGEEKKKNSIR